MIEKLWQLCNDFFPASFYIWVCKVMMDMSEEDFKLYLWALCQVSVASASVYKAVKTKKKTKK